MGHGFSDVVNVCVRVHFVVLDVREATPDSMLDSPLVGWVWYSGGVSIVYRVTVVIASGKRPVTFRTRKLRLTAPMVLHSGGCGRVGHRRTPFGG